MSAADRAPAPSLEFLRPPSRPCEPAEIMVEQFTIAGHRVLAFETIRPRSAELWDVIVFRVVDATGALVRTVQLETGAYGRARGIPYLMSVRSRTAYRVLDLAFAARPSYATLKLLARDLIAREIAPTTL